MVRQTEHLILFKPHSLKDGTATKAIDVLLQYIAFGSFPQDFRLPETEVIQLRRFEFCKLACYTINTQSLNSDNEFIKILYPKIREEDYYYPTLKQCLTGIVRIWVLYTNIPLTKWEEANNALTAFRGTNRVVSYDQKVISTGSGIRGYLQGEIITSNIELTQDTPANQQARMIRVSQNILHVPDNLDEVRSIVNFLNL